MTRTAKWGTAARCLGAASSIAILVSADLALAQIEEIEVTAQRRQERLLDVPLSVTAVSGDTLNQFNITDPTRLALTSPGVTFSETGSAVRFNIRGVGTNIFENIADPVIAFSENGVYRSRNAQANVAFLDVDRIEILRGPQGTLQGRNATGGAINVISQLPTDEFEAEGEVTVGNYSLIRADAIVNIPLTDTFKARFAGRREVRDGYVENFGPGENLADEDLVYGRGTFQFTPQQNFDAVLHVSYLYRDRAGRGGLGAKLLGESINPNNPGAPQSGTIFGERNPVNPRVLDGIPETFDPTANGGSGGLVDRGVPLTTDPYAVRTDFDNTEETRSFDIDLQLTYDFGPVSVKSITAYTDFSNFPFNDNDFTDLVSEGNVGGSANRVSLLSTEAETIIQEVQFSSEYASPLQWIAGVFYMNDETFEIFSIEDFDDTFPFSPAGPPTALLFDRNTNTDTSSIAGFGELTYEVSEALTVFAGGRYTRDKKDFRLREFGFLGALGFNPPLDIEETFSKFTWRAGAQYFLADDNMAYFTASTGFRSGGFSRIADIPETPGDETTFDSETITSYEIGTKNRFLENRLEVNLAGYYSKVEDQQVAATVIVAGTGQSFFQNAAETEIYGFEAEMQAQPTDEWFAYGTFTWQNAEYQEFTAPGLTQDPTAIDLSGNDTPFTPEFRLSLSTGYDIIVPGWGTFTPQVTFQYVDDYFATQFNTSIGRQESYTQTDLRLSYQTENNRLGAEVFVQNLEDEAVLTRGTFGGSDAFFAGFGAPRTIGFRFNFNY